MKACIFLVLFSSAIFARLIPALSSGSSDGQNGDTNANESQNNESSSEEYENLVAYDGGPALSCILFKNLGCNTKCKIVANAFSIKAFGRCTEDFACQCTFDLENSLESLFKAKFSLGEAWERIERDENLHSGVLKVLRIPFQTVRQTKEQLREVVYPNIHKKLSNKDETVAATLVERNGDLNRDEIKDYIAERMGFFLKSPANVKKWKNINYEENMREALNAKTGDDLQSIVHEVRRTNNKKLSDLVDDYLKSKNIDEKPITDKTDTLAEAMSYLIIDMFANEIENEKLAAKKRAEKLSSAKTTLKKKSKKDKTSQGIQQ